MVFVRSFSYHQSHRRIHGESLGVVGVFLSRETAVGRLPEEGSYAVLGILACTLIGEQLPGRCCQVQRSIEFAIGEESSVTRHLGSVEFQLQRAVETDT